MNSQKRQKTLEKIIYKIFRKVKLDESEKKVAEEIVEIKDYGMILE